MQTLPLQVLFVTIQLELSPPLCPQTFALQIVQFIGKPSRTVQHSPRIYLYYGCCLTGWMVSYALGWSYGNSCQSRADDSHFIFLVAVLPAVPNILDTVTPILVQFYPLKLPLPTATAQIAQRPQIYNSCLQWILRSGGARIYFTYGKLHLRNCLLFIAILKLHITVNKNQYRTKLPDNMFRDKKEVFYGLELF